MEKMNHDLLMKALTALGQSPFDGTKGRIIFDTGSYDGKTGLMTLQNVSDVNAFKNKVKRAYNSENLKHSCQKYGWAIKETAPYEYEIVQR